jgi:hypothetical protein
MSQTDPWAKAAECIDAIRESSEPELRSLLAAIRDRWIQLANQRLLLTDAEFARETARVARMHSHLIDTGVRRFRSDEA